MRPASPVVRHAPPAALGFTLVELLTVITIIAIGAALAMPSLRAALVSQRVRAASTDLMSSLLIARSEAIKRNAAVTIAPDTADTWIAGWTVKVGTTILLQQQALSGVSITKAASAAAIPSNFVYGANGRLSSATATQYLQVNGGSAVKCVKVDLTGIPSTQTTACP